MLLHVFQIINKEMSHYVKIVETYRNVDDSGNAAVPPEKFDEIRKRYNNYWIYYKLLLNVCLKARISKSRLAPSFSNSLTNIRVSAKYRGIKLEYRESRHTVLDLLSQIRAQVQSWNAPYRSQESMHVLLQDWHVSAKATNTSNTSSEPFGIKYGKKIRKVIVFIDLFSRKQLSAETCFSFWQMLSKPWKRRRMFIPAKQH